MKNWIIASFVALSATVVSAENAPDVAAACAACHGKAGVSNSQEWPNLAGQKAGYLADQITAFRDGSRANPAMAPFVKDLTDADISELARYYAGQKLAVAGNGDRALVRRGENLSGYCKACHGMQGVPVADVWPVIAGQQAAYLQKQLAMFKSGARINGHMQAAISALGEAEFAALAAYYSQLNPDSR